MKTAQNTTTTSLIEFVNAQLGIYCRTNGIANDKEAVRSALVENKAKWVKMFILSNA